MNKTILYLSPKYTEDSQLLWKAALKLNWDVQRLSWSIMDHLDVLNIDRVIYGETSFLSLAAEKLKIKLLTAPNNFLYRLDYSLTKRKILHYTYDKFSGFGKCIYNNSYDVDEYEVYDWYDLKGPLFVKPVKKGLFAAKIYENPVAEIKNLPDKTEVIVSEPVKWDVEFRAFISEKKVKTISPYSRGGELIEQATALEWEQAEKFANSVAAHCHWPGVIDIGYIVPADHNAGGWSVVEGNGAWGSGLYGCDPIEALKVIKMACKSS